MPKGKRIDVDWLRGSYPRMTTIDELLDDHEREFGWRPTRTAVYVKANRLGIRKDPVAGRDQRAERTVRWSDEPEMRAWMLAHDHGQRADRLGEEFREAFGFGLTRAQVSLFRASHGTQARRSHGGGRHRVPVGGERVGKDGYVVVKVSEEATVPMSKDNWRLKHVHVWERENGPLPEGHCVYFADGDRRNFDPGNLVAVPRRLVGVLSTLRHEGAAWHDRESLEAAVALAELRVARAEAESRMPRTCPVCGREFDNLARRAASNFRAVTCPDCAAAGHKPPGRRGGRRYQFDHAEILRLKATGLTATEVARRVGCSESTVYAATREARLAGGEAT